MPKFHSAAFADSFPRDQRVVNYTCLSLFRVPASDDELSEKTVNGETRLVPMIGCGRVATS